MDIEYLMRLWVDVRKDYGTIPAILAALVSLKVEDERVLEIARVYCSRFSNPLEVPDWIRCLANASNPTAVRDAYDDMMADDGVLV